MVTPYYGTETIFGIEIWGINIENVD